VKELEHAQNVNQELLKQTYTPLDFKGKLHTRQIHLPEGFFDQEPLHGGFSCFCEGKEPCASCLIDDQLDSRDQRWDLPFLFFNLFFDDNVLDDIARATNRYADYKREATPLEEGRKRREWREISGPELMIWCGLLLYMGALEISPYTYLWSQNSELPRHCIARFFSQIRWEEIKRYLHISLPLEPGRPVHEKVEPLATELSKRFRKFVTPGSFIAIDEMMVRCKAHSAPTWSMKQKPIKSGYKIYGLAEAGYLYSFRFTSPPKQGDGEEGEYYGVTTHELAGGTHLKPLSNMVLDLCLDLPYKRYSFILFTDNLFSNIPLFKILRDYGIGACGTARANSAKYPLPHRLIQKVDSGMAFHEYTTITVDEVLSIVWQDRSLVRLLTTVYLAEDFRKVNRRRPRRVKSTFHDAINNLWAGQGRAPVPTPYAAIEYNNHMGGVDISDQYRALTTTHQRGWRIWLPLFYYLLDVAVTNAFLIARTTFFGSTAPILNDSRKFRVRLAWNLVLIGLIKLHRDVIFIRYPPTQKELNHLAAQRHRQYGYVTKHRELPVTRHQPGNHDRQRRKNTNTSPQCWFCRWKEQRGLTPRGERVHRTQWQCSICGPGFPLCEACFVAFHQHVGEGE
jgi:hypothetical protein